MVTGNMLILNCQECKTVFDGLFIDFLNGCVKRWELANLLFNTDLKQTYLAKKYHMFRILDQFHYVSGDFWIVFLEPDQAVGV